MLNRRTALVAALGVLLGALPATGARAQEGGGWRAALGLYGMYLPERTFGRDLRFSTFGFGAVADVRPLSAPLGGRVDPFLSLGTGLLLTPGVALQGDVRDLMTFRGDTRHNLGVGAGVRLGF